MTLGCVKFSLLHVKERERQGKGERTEDLQKHTHPLIPDFTSPASVRRFTLYSNSLYSTFHEGRSPSTLAKRYPGHPGRGHGVATLEPQVQGAGLQGDLVFTFLSRVSPVPTSPSWALLGQHREPGVSEAPSCQVCRLLSLQSLNFKLDRDCEVPKGREQERHLRGRGPGSWASGARGLDPGPAQLSVSAGNALSTASLRSPQPWVTTPVVCSATCRHPGHWANREEARRIHLAW